ncbi:MAG: hypothetical protein AAGJ35_14745 [Myxococcota bacterium]
MCSILDAGTATSCYEKDSCPVPGCNFKPNECSDFTSILYSNKCSDLTSNLHANVCTSWDDVEIVVQKEIFFKQEDVVIEKEIFLQQEDEVQEKEIAPSSPSWLQRVEERSAPLSLLHLTTTKKKQNNRNKSTAWQKKQQ